MTRLNYTGRQRVTRDRVRLRLKEGDGRLLLDVQRLDLKGLGLPNNAEVVVEAYRQTTRQRVPCGTTGALCLPRSVPLSEFDVPDGLLFRVKVVGVGDTDGKLLAAGDRIPATTDGEKGDRIPILPFLPSSDLGQQLWRLDTDPEPTLLVNIEVGNWKGLVLQPQFQALVFPEIVRQVAIWVLANLDDAEEGDSVTGNWRRFLAGLGKDPVMETPDKDDREQWADDVTAAFARRHKFLDRIIDSINAEAAGP